jgi:hypothetical protein
MRFAFDPRKLHKTATLAVVLMFMFGSLVTLGACGRKAPPRLPGIKPPPVVTDLQYQLSGGNMILTWSVPSSDRGTVADISGFAVHRALRAAADARCATCPFEYKRIATVPFDGAGGDNEKRLTVRYQEKLQIGHHYAYRVRVIGKGNNEGEMSAPVSFVYE